MRKSTQTLTTRLYAVCVWAVLATVAAPAQTTTFTYQGKLTDAGQPANGTFDLQFALFDAASGGIQQGATVTREDVSVTNGVFTVSLDFGAGAFPGAARFLELAVRPGASTGAFTPLAPRQPVQATPYALRSLNAGNADNAAQLGGVAAANYLQTVARDASLSGNGTAGSPLGIAANSVGTAQLANNAVTNAKIAAGQVVKSLNGLTDNVTLVAGANISLTPSGNTLTIAAPTALPGWTLSGNAGTNPASQFLGTTDNQPLAFRVNGVEMMRLSASGNLGLGTTNPTEKLVVMGNATLTGALEALGQSSKLRFHYDTLAALPSAATYHGMFAHVHDVGKAYYAHAGAWVPLANEAHTHAAGDLTSGVLDAARGGTGLGTTGAAGNYLRSNGTVWTSSPLQAADLPGGSANYIQNTTAPQAASNFNISGIGTANILNAATQFNLFDNRILSTPGTDSLAVGLNAGLSNLGSQNAFVGNGAGQNNLGGSDNTFLGAYAGFQNTGNANTFAGVSAGYNNQGEANSFFGRSAGFQNTTGESNSFFGVQAGRDNNVGFSNSFFGRSAGQSNQAGANNSFFGEDAGYLNTAGSGNSFFGSDAGLTNTEGKDNSYFGAAAGLSNGVGSGNSFFGSNAGNQNLTGSNNTGIGYLANVSSDNVSYATAIGARAVVTASNKVQIGRVGMDRVAIGAFAMPSTSDHVCINALGEFTACSSSLRYKEAVRPLRQGLRLIQRLRPVTFNWKESQQPDLGLIAEEVNAVEPLLNTYNRQGEIDGVKYTQLTVVLINAVKEQQGLLEQQQAQLNAQRQELDALKQAFCAARPQAKLCPPRRSRLTK